LDIDIKTKNNMKRILKILIVCGVALLIPVTITSIICAALWPELYHKAQAPLWFAIPAFGALGLILFPAITLGFISYRKQIIEHIKSFINS
jgi:hypothetical protein